MKGQRREKIAFLDQVRMRRGNDSLIQSFRNTLRANREQALRYLTDEHLCFPTVYVLKEEIEKEQLLQGLNENAQFALEFVKNGHSDVQGWLQGIQPSLLWMIQSGGEDHVDSFYLKKIDDAAGLLTSVYGNRSVLQAIARIIFFRCRNHLPYHNLIWAFLEAREPYSLALIAEYLLSENQAECDCARKMLSFIPGIKMGKTHKGEASFLRFREWMEENGPFLYFKGETFDTTHLPAPYVAVLPAKYIGAFVSTYDGRPYSSLTKKENRLWKQLEQCPLDVQHLLADYSARLRATNPEQWGRWMALSIRKQLREAEGGTSID